jgi:multidrug resistance efflux pump
MEKKMNKDYEPDNQFVENLEWQLSSEFRRASRLKPSPGKIAVPRRMVAIALAVGVLMTGVAVTKAADYIKDSWQKKIEMARVETEVELKKVQLESIREMASGVKTRVADGLIREDEYQAMKIAVENAELDLKRSLLNLDEVKMSGEIPRSELYAPMVSGRDFVSERLKIERKEVELVLEQLNVHLERISRLVEQNLIRGDEMDHIQAEIAMQKVKIDKIQERLDLRTRFLARDITAREVELKGRLTASENNFQLAQSKVDSLLEQLNRLQALETRGAVSHMEVKQLEFALDAAQAELKLAILEMDVLRKLR